MKDYVLVIFNLLVNFYRDVNISVLVITNNTILNVDLVVTLSINNDKPITNISIT